MNYLICAIILIISIAVYIVKKDFKFIRYIIIGYMGILFCGSIDNADYYNYLNKYNSIISNNTIENFKESEVGFNLLIKFFGGLGLNYKEFLIVIYILSILLILNFIKNFAINKNLILILYFIYPFLLDVVQIRHFLAMAIIINSFKYLIQNSKIKYILMIFIATSIHYIALIFLLVIFLDFIEEKKFHTVCLVIFLIVSLLVKTGLVQNLIYIIIPENEVKYYFENTAGLGIILELMIESLIVFSIYYIRKCYNKIFNKSEYIEIIYKINIILISLLPICIINGNFSRMYRILLIPNYIVYSIFLHNLDKKNRMFYFVLIVIFLIFMFIWVIYIPNFEQVIKPTFEYNFYFNN